MVCKPLSTHPHCVNPSACDCKYNFALKAFAFGVRSKKDANFSQAMLAFQCALTLLQGALYDRNCGEGGLRQLVNLCRRAGNCKSLSQHPATGCCHANAAVLTLSVAFRLAETRLRAHQFEAAVDGATWCLQAARQLGVASSMDHQIFLVRGLALLSLGQCDAALRDIRAGCEALPSHRVEQGAACLQHIYQALADNDKDSSTSSQESTITNEDEVTSAPLLNYYESAPNKRMRL